MARHKMPHTVILPKPAPCRESYWIGATREQLQARVAQERPRQWVPTPADVKFDPALDATASLMQHKEWAKARRELGR